MGSSEGSQSPSPNGVGSFSDKELEALEFTPVPLKLERTLTPRLKQTPTPTSKRRKTSILETFSSTRPPTHEQGCALAEGMFLAGQPLKPPAFHHVSWKVGQRFKPSADPDRARDVWHPPAFVWRDPAIQHSNISVEELSLPWKPDDHSFARVLRGVLNEKDCAELIDAVNAKGFTPALLNVGGGVQQLMPHFRDGFRVIVDNVPLATWLLEVLRPYLPAAMADDVRLESLNERCRFLCYTPGQEFGQHYDACFVHPSTKARSLVTVQLYLHDVPLENGGATTFLFGQKSHGRFPNISCQPGAGSVLLFSQDLLHEGSLVKSGLKYTFRTEAMYL